MEEINNFGQENVKYLYQAWERFKELLMKCPQHYLTEMQELQAQLNNLGREIKKVNEKVYAAHVGCELCKGPHYTKDCPLKEEARYTLETAYTRTFGGPFQGGGYRAAALGFYQRNNVNPSYQERRQSMKERGFGSLPSSTEANPRDQVKSISTTIKVDSYPIRRIGSSQYAVSTGQSRTLILRERIELDLEARLMGETLVLSRLLDPFLEDYIILNDVKGTFELRRNQGDDLMPTIKEDEVIEEFRTRDDELNVGIDDYPSYYDYDKKIHIDCNWSTKGNNVVGALMNIPIFVGTFSVMIDFAVLENMDDYRDEGMSDPDAAAGAVGVAKDSPFIDEGGQANLVPVQAPPPLPAATKTMPQRMSRLEEDVHEIRRALAEQREDLGSKEISTNIGREFTNLEDLEVLES
ncbi:reverse transcriptase domain-containing protein [Tanacetum coccineum]